ncbi:MAG: cytochrome c biogenesis protein CcsA [Deltaproteobacteria bacterium]|nr:cytochrome c biogenesis protein CcsA [Deltaproteobacteria bacterium]
MDTDPGIHPAYGPYRHAVDRDRLYPVGEHLRFSLVHRLGRCRLVSCLSGKDKDAGAGGLCVSAGCRNDDSGVHGIDGWFPHPVRTARAAGFSPYRASLDRRGSLRAGLHGSLGDLDRINHLCTVWGFPLLTFGIIAGSIWARTVWGSNWHWDPKQVFTAVSWVLYAVLVHQRIAIGWKGRKVALLSIIAFAGLLFAFIGVNALFVTMHRF